MSLRVSTALLVITSALHTSIACSLCDTVFVCFPCMGVACMGSWGMHLKMSTDHLHATSCHASMHERADLHDVTPSFISFLLGRVVHVSTVRTASDCPHIWQVTTEKQREAFRKALMEVEDWLYTDGEAEKAPVFRWAACCLSHTLPVAPLIQACLVA